MGLLDDAIREHLDLKRRRGADPAEIERAEREALGPVRRGPEEAESEDLAGTAVAYDHQADEQEWEESFADESEPDIPDFLAGRPRPLTFEDESADDQVAYDEPTAPESGGSRELAELDETHTAEDAGPAHEPGSADLPGRGEPGARAVPRPHPAPDAGVPSAADTAPDSPSPEPPPPAPASASPHRAPVEPDQDHVPGETAEYDVEHALRQEGEDPSEDVLEETPEFLQDTPDHDRLWFEQRPPKDFDFDS